jgi:hypothetical protein
LLKLSIGVVFATKVHTSVSIHQLQTMALHLGLIRLRFLNDGVHYAHGLNWADPPTPHRHILYTLIARKGLQGDTSNL